jgi:hypothetical protein
MAVAYEITLKGERTERVDGADAYAQEGQLTTFFRTDPDRGTVDRWSVRLAPPRARPRRRGGHLGRRRRPEQG